MTILGIESSCDETSAAVIKADEKNTSVELLSNVIASSLDLHAQTGGIIPEVAARKQIELILPVIQEALNKAKINQKDIDAIAVTYGPGLIGSLLIGVETAKTLSLIWQKPLVPVNHLYGHIYANFIQEKNNLCKIPNLPGVGLVVSGGHTDLVLLEKHGKLIWLGGTRDDAAGEAMDKIGRLIGLPYPGGPAIEKAALNGKPKIFKFPRPLLGSDDFDFSFSGLKTAVLREVRELTKNGKQLTKQQINDISAEVQQAVTDVIVTKTFKAVKKYQAKTIMIGGGAAANQKLRETLAQKSQELGATLHVPAKNLCTDNAAMIAAAAFFNYQYIEATKVTANPELYFD